MNESGAYVLEELDPAEARAGLVRAGGKPYILITLVDRETGAIDLLSQGFSLDQITGGLYEAAYQLEKQQIEEAIASGAFDVDEDGPSIEQQLDGLAEVLERAKQL